MATLIVVSDTGTVYQVTLGATNEVKELGEKESAAAKADVAAAGTLCSQLNDKTSALAEFRIMGTLVNLPKP